MPGPWRRPVLGLSASLVILLLLELLARGLSALAPGLYAVDRPSWGEGADIGLLQSDAALLWRMDPGERRDGGVGVRINSWGLRGPEPGPENPGRADILVLGDSSIFGWGVEEEDTFVSRLGEALGQKGHRVRVINGGTPGYSSTQSRFLLEQLVQRFTPEVVVVCNLWSDQIRSTHTDRELYAMLGDPAHQRALERRGLLAELALFRLLEARLLSFRPLPRNRQVLFNTILLGDPKAPKLRVPAGLHRENLDAMGDIIEARGGRALGLVLPANRSVGAPKDRELAPYQENLVALSRRFGAEAVDVDGRWRQEADTGALFLDVVHPSPAGHARIVQQLLPAVEALLP